MNKETDRFLQLYKQLEFDGRRIYFPDAKESDNILGRLINLPYLKPYKEDLDYCRVVRNFLTHNPKVGGVYPIVPSEEMVALLEKCVNILNNPPTALDFSIPADEIFIANLDDLVLKVIDEMNLHTYTHVPVMDNGRMVGVFSDNTVYSYICEEKHISINEKTTIRKFEKYVNFDEHLNEYFEFFPKYTMLYEIENHFKLNYKNHRKKLLAVAYITENGKRNEPILGMLTPWDILSDLN